MYTHPSIHTCMHARMHTTHMQTRIYTHIYTYIPTYMHACMHAYMHSSRGAWDVECWPSGPCMPSAARDLSPSPLARPRKVMAPPARGGRTSWSSRKQLRPPQENSRLPRTTLAGATSPGSIWAAPVLRSSFCFLACMLDLGCSALVWIPQGFVEKGRRLAQLGVVDWSLNLPSDPGFPNYHDGTTSLSYLVKFPLNER